MLEGMASELAEKRDKEGLLSLAEVGVGGDFQIERLDGPGCEQLRRLGFCETLSVRKLSEGRNLVCSLCGTRLALSAELAAQVKVSPVEAA